MGIGVDTLTLLKKNLAIRTFTTCHEDYNVVTRREGRNIGHSIGNLPADGIKTAKCSRGRDMVLNVAYDFMEFVEIFSGLRVELDIV